MKKIILFISCLVFLGASCDLFAKPKAAGILKTVNGGTDWQFINTLKDSQSGLSGMKISRLLLDPKNREVVYASSYNGGLYKSDNYGQDWSRILSKIQVYDFAVDSIDAKILYTAGIYNTFGKILRTKDGGKTWNEVYNEQGADNPVRAIVLNPLNPSQILAGTANGNLVLSLDEGQTWKLVNNFEDRIQRLAWQADKILVLTKKKGLYEGNSVGQNFKLLTENLTRSVDLNNLSYNTEAVNSFNQFFADEIPGNLLYLTTNRGLYKSVDSGKTWKYITLPVKQEDGEAWAVYVPKSSSSIVYVSVGITIYKSLDGGESFQTQSLPATGSINGILVDPAQPQTAYAGIYFDD